MRLLRALLLALSAVACPAAGAEDLKPWRGGAPPALALPDLAGKARRLEDYRGKVVLVNFWATWCEPCRDEMPSLGRLKKALAGRPFEVLAVNLSEPESRVRKFMEQVPMDFTVLLDRDGGTAKAWGARVLPMTFVIGPDGKIRYSHRGDLDWSQDSVQRAVSALLPR